MRAAGDDTPTPPEDPAALRALLLEMLAKCDTLAAERKRGFRALLAGA